MTYRCQYIYSRPFGWPVHVWELVGSAGGLHLHIRDTEGVGDCDRYIGGIEVHYRSPPDYMRDQPPSHDECHVLKAPCWHDGSSMQATDIWIPMWESVGHDNDRMFELLSAEADKRLAT